MVRPTRASCVGISQQWRASFTDGNSVTPAQVTSIKVKDKSINLIDLASIEVSVEIAPSPEAPRPHRSMNASSFEIFLG